MQYSSVAKSNQKRKNIPASLIFLVQCVYVCTNVCVCVQGQYFQNSTSRIFFYISVLYRQNTHDFIFVVYVHSHMREFFFYYKMYLCVHTCMYVRLHPPKKYIREPHIRFFFI